MAWHKDLPLLLTRINEMIYERPCFCIKYMLSLLINISNNINQNTTLEFKYSNSYSNN